MVEAQSLLCCVSAPSFSDRISPGLLSAFGDPVTQLSKYQSHIVFWSALLRSSSSSFSSLRELGSVLTGEGSCRSGTHTTRNSRGSSPFGTMRLGVASEHVDDEVVDSMKGGEGSKDCNVSLLKPGCQPKPAAMLTEPQSNYKPYNQSLARKKIKRFPRTPG